MATAAAGSESDFSTSSVDQFLRDHGFDIADHAGIELSSLSDDDESDRGDEQLQQQQPPGNASPNVGGNGARTPSRLRVTTAMTPPPSAEGSETMGDTPSRRSERRRRRSFADAQSASEEEEPVTPRFTLLHDKDVLLVERAAAAAAAGTLAPTAERLEIDEGAEERPSDDERDSLDRSMVLGVGSGFSGFSSSATDERSRIAQILHEKGASPVVTIQRSRAHRSDSRSSSSGSFTSGSRRVLDDELSDALGVTSSTPEQGSSMFARGASSRASRTSTHQRRMTAPTAPSSHNRHAAGAVSSTRHSSQRALFSADAGDEEQRDGGDVGARVSFHSNQQQRPSFTSEHAYVQRESAPAILYEPREEARTLNGGDEASSASEDSSSWNELNDKLRKHGLQVITFQKIQTARGRAVTVPARASVFDFVQDAVLQLERKDQIIQDLILESNRNSREQSRAEGDLQSVEKKSEEVRNALESAKAEVARLQEKLKHGKDEAEEQTKKLKQSCLRLQQQLKVSEHRVKAKEVLVERIQQKLQQQVDKENLSKTRDRQMFRQIQQRDVKKTNPRDSQSLEFIGVFETQREQMQEEIDHLKSQVTALNAELRDKENYIARKASSSARQETAAWESGGGVGDSPVSGRWRQNQASASVVSDDMMLERLEAARREQEQAAAKLRRREAAMIKKVSMIEQELLLAHESIAELKEENANLTLEAESRPSIRDYRLCQRRIHQLERQVSESKLALEEATDLNELRKYMGTKELIERDRLNHRLHLNRLNTLPRETTLEVVKEVCRVLNLTDITLITPSLEKLCRVVAAVPRMEKFIRDVCGFVFLNVQADGGESRKSGFELEQVLPTLQQWAAERRKLHALEEFKVSITSELCKRSIEPSVLSSENDNGSAQSQPSTLSRAVHIVSELVDIEKSVMHHREIYSQAATELERRPSVLVNQIVRHFSHLFQVKSVEGVLPKINEIYLFVNEMENFLNVVRGLLQLKKQASVVVCLNAVRQKLEDIEDGHSPRSPVEEQRRENRDPNGDFEPNFVVEKNSATAIAGGGDLAGVRQVREMTILVRDLKRELGAASMHEILPRTKRLMELLSLSIHNNSFDEDD